MRSITALILCSFNLMTAALWNTGWQDSNACLPDRQALRQDLSADLSAGRQDRQERSIPVNLIRLRKPSKKAWDNPHNCLICGKGLDVVTHAHAENHGYESREALLRSGMVELVKEKQRTHDKER